LVKAIVPLFVTLPLTVTVTPPVVYVPLVITKFPVIVAFLTLPVRLPAPATTVTLVNDVAKPPFNVVFDPKTTAPFPPLNEVTDALLVKNPLTLTW